MGTFALFLGISLLIATLVVAVVVLAFTQQVTDFFSDPWGNTRDMFGLDGGDSTPEVVNTKIIVLDIKRLALLETTRSDILVREDVVKEKTFILKDAKLRIEYIGRVTAGIDLSQITEKSIVTQSDGSLRIALPPAQITGCYLQQPEVISSTCGTSMLGTSDCTGIMKELEETAYSRGLQYLVEQANELKLLDDATQNAETAIRDLLHDLGFDKIEFIPSVGYLSPDDSCAAS